MALTAGCPGERQSRLQREGRHARTGADKPGRVRQADCARPHVARSPTCASREQRSQWSGLALLGLELLHLLPALLGKEPERFYGSIAHELQRSVGALDVRRNVRALDLSSLSVFGAMPSRLSSFWVPLQNFVWPSDLSAVAVRGSPPETVLDFQTPPFLRFRRLGRLGRLRRFEERLPLLGWAAGRAVLLGIRHFALAREGASSRCYLARSCVQEPAANGSRKGGKWSQKLRSFVCADYLKLHILTLTFTPAPSFQDRLTVLYACAQKGRD